MLNIMIFILGLLMLNIKARQDILEFSTASLLSIHILALGIDFAQFLLNSHLAAHQVDINLRKV